MKIRYAAGIGAVVSIVLVMTGVGALASETTTQREMGHLTVLKTRYDEGVSPHVVARSSRAATTPPSIRLFHRTVTDGGTGHARARKFTGAAGDGIEHPGGGRQTE